MAIDHVEGPLPSSTPLERDARLVSTDHKVAPSEIAIGVIIGRAAEYFDFFVFAIASVVVFPEGVLPVRGTRDGDALLLRRLLAGLRRPADRLGHLHGRRSPARPRRQADHRAVPARLLHHGDLLPARLRADRRLVPVPPRRPADRAGPGARRRVGRARLAPRAQRADRAPRLLRRHRRSSGRRSASSWRAPCSRSSCSTCRRPTSWIGAGAIPSSAPSRSTSWPCSRGCGSSRPTSSRAFSNSGGSSPRRSCRSSGTTRANSSSAR